MRNVICMFASIKAASLHSPYYVLVAFKREVSREERVMGHMSEKWSGKTTCSTIGFMLVFALLLLIYPYCGLVLQKKVDSATTIALFCCTTIPSCQGPVAFFMPIST